MVQTTTPQSMLRMLPGHISTPEGPGRETESIMVPFTPQQVTLTVAGDTPAVAGDYVIPFVTPANGTLNVTVTATGAQTHTQFATAIAAAINAKLGVSSLWSATSAVGVVTLVNRSSDLSFAVPVTADITIPGATTITAAQSVAAAAPGLRIGVWYVYGAAPPAFVGAISGTPRAPRNATLPTSSTTAALLRGVVARTVNQTQLAATALLNATTPDAYDSGQVAFGALRGVVDVVVDPASPSFTEASAVYVVIAAGTYSVIGSVATAADGGNTIRLDNTTPVRARVAPGSTQEETHAMGGESVRLVRLQVNQTN